MSCDPKGAPPTEDVWGSQGGRFITNDGRVFFETVDPLDPRDTNGVGDVYEFVDGKPQLITTGTGTATGAEGEFSAESISGLYGVSADGVDVYFGTFDTLVGQDRNGQSLKFYDARTGGGFPYVPPPLPCEAADECHGTTSEAAQALRKGTVSDLGKTPETSRRRRRRRRRNRENIGKFVSTTVGRRGTVERGQRRGRTTRRRPAVPGGTSENVCEAEDRDDDRQRRRAVCTQRDRCFRKRPGAGLRHHSVKHAGRRASGPADLVLAANGAQTAGRNRPQHGMRLPESAIRHHQHSGRRDRQSARRTPMQGSRFCE